jgi:hypothetical protein
MRIGSNWKYENKFIEIQNNKKVPLPVRAHLELEAVLRLKSGAAGHGLRIFNKILAHSLRSGSNSDKHGCNHETRSFFEKTAHKERLFQKAAGHGFEP